MIRRPPRSTLDRSSAASDVYKRQQDGCAGLVLEFEKEFQDFRLRGHVQRRRWLVADPVSYTHLRAHETVLDLVCRLLLETKNITRHLLCF